MSSCQSDGSRVQSCHLSRIRVLTNSAFQVIPWLSEAEVSLGICLGFEHDFFSYFHCCNQLHLLFRCKTKLIKIHFNVNLTFYAILQLKKSKFYSENVILHIWFLNVLVISYCMYIRVLCYNLCYIFNVYFIIFMLCFCVYDTVWTSVYVKDTKYIFIVKQPCLFSGKLL